MDEKEDSLFVARSSSFDYDWSNGYAIGDRWRDNPIVSGFPTRELAKQGLARLRQRHADGEEAISIDVSDWRVFVEAAR